jgi:serine/threonine-protein kinase
MPDVPFLQRFLAELKRRHVFRVAAVYGATAFVVLQVADLLQEGLHLPEIFLTGVTVLALLGFPFALVLAWAYERTSAGVVRTGDASDSEIEALAHEPAARRWPVGLAALGGVALLVAGAWWVLGRPDTANARSYDSIVVLPFVDLSGDPENEYLGDGLAEELLNALVRIDGLNVASRTSAFAFKNTQIGASEIGDSLGVETVLEGSVRRSPGRLRITAQLIDTNTGFHLWSETYDRAPADLLDIQDELTDQIIGALRVQFEENSGDDDGVQQAAQRPTTQRGTEIPEAYDYYLQGRYFWNKRSAEDMNVAVGLFEKAIEADSSFAAAYASIAEAYAVPSGWADGTQEALDKAEQYARLALDIDPALAQAHNALAFVLFARDLDFRDSEASFIRAIELNPNYATARQWYAEVLVVTGRAAEAVEQAKLAEELDPTTIIRWNRARTLYLTGHFEEAIEKAAAIVNENRSMVSLALAIQADAYQMLRDHEAMLSVLATLVPPLNAALQDSLAASDQPIDVYFPGLLARAIDRDMGTRDLLQSPAQDSFEIFLSARAWTWVDRDTAIARLGELAARPDDADFRYEWSEVLADPAFAEIRADPRFAELNAQFGL